MLYATSFRIRYFMLTVVLVFVGAVVAIQMYNNFSASSFPIPTSFVGYATKAVLVLEFSPTIIKFLGCTKSAASFPVEKYIISIGFRTTLLFGMLM